jgi:hypothetical protein
MVPDVMTQKIKLESLTPEMTALIKEATDSLKGIPSAKLEAILDVVLAKAAEDPATTAASIAAAVAAAITANTPDVGARVAWTMQLAICQLQLFQRCGIEDAISHANTACDAYCARFCDGDHS